MDFTQAADDMVQQQLVARGISDPAVLDAMRTTPRHRFVPHVSPHRAYGDHALPTADGQTISQPYIVAVMTELLRLEPGQRVLEIGTGSGYQTAILLALGAHVVSLERSAKLAERAKQALADICPEAALTLVVGDGSLGHPDLAPYDRILVTAAAPALPPALEEQLAPAGRIVIPLGERHQQILTLFEHSDGKLRSHPQTPCHFVPLVGAAAWPA